MRSLEAVDAGDVAAFAHGMTVATNALLERRGAPHRARDHGGLPRPDRARRARTARRSTTSPSAARSRSCRASCASPSASAWGRDGELEPLDEDSFARRRRGAARGRASRRSPCACCSRSCTPTTSAASARPCARRCRDVHVSLSSEVLPEFREYERFSTTVADAYLAPRLRAYLERLAASARRGGRAGAAGDAVLGRRARRERRGRAGRRLRALGPGRRGGRRGARGARERLRGRAHLRHGRHEHRRRAGASAARRAPRPSPWSRACRSSCRWSTSTPSAPAAARSRGPTPAARCASARARRAPIPAPRPTARAARSRR